jgi:hypothetical protein
MIRPGWSRVPATIELCRFLVRCPILLQAHAPEAPSFGQDPYQCLPDVASNSTSQLELTRGSRTRPSRTCQSRQVRTAFRPARRITAHSDEISDQSGFSRSPSANTTRDDVPFMPTPRGTDVSPTEPTTSPPPPARAASDGRPGGRQAERRRRSICGRQRQ